MKLLGETIHFRKNLTFSLKRYTIWWVILTVTMIFDIFTTTVFTAKYGIDAEANLTTRFLMHSSNPILGNVLGKLLQLMSVICFAGLHIRLGNLFLLFIILINCWAVVVNSMAY